MSQPDPSRLVVCERNNRWAIALRRRFGSVRRVGETRTLHQLWQELVVSPQSAVLIEVQEESQIQPTAAWLYEARRAYPEMASFVALTSDLKPAGRLFLEFGANQILHSTARIDGAVHVMDLHLKKHGEVSPADDIWQHLPWNDDANDLVHP